MGCGGIGPDRPRKGPTGPEKAPISPEKARFPRKDFPPIFSENLGLKLWHGEVRVYREVRVYPAECGEQLGRDPSKIGCSKSLVLKGFSREGTLWDSSPPVSLTLWDAPALFTPPLPLPQLKPPFVSPRLDFPKLLRSPSRSGSLRKLVAELS